MTGFEVKIKMKKTRGAGHVGEPTVLNNGAPSKKKRTPRNRKCGIGPWVPWAVSTGTGLWAPPKKVTGTVCEHGGDDKIGNLGGGWLGKETGECRKDGLGASKGVSPVSNLVGHRMRSTHQGLLLLMAQQISVDRELAGVRAGAERGNMSRAGGRESTQYL